MTPLPFQGRDEPLLLTSSKRDEPLLPVAFGEREERSTDPSSILRRSRFAHLLRRLVSLRFTEGDDPSSRDKSSFPVFFRLSSEDAISKNFTIFNGFIKREGRDKLFSLEDGYATLQGGGR